MKKIKLRGVEDNNHYYLLESTELQDHEIGFVKGFIEESDIVKMIKEGGVLSSANKFLVMKTTENNKSVEYLRFYDDSQFVYIES
jgi:hypothetical protein